MFTLGPVIINIAPNLANTHHQNSEGYLEVAPNLTNILDIVLIKQKLSKHVIHIFKIKRQKSKWFGPWDTTTWWSGLNVFATSLVATLNLVTIYLLRWDPIIFFSHFRSIVNLPEQKIWYKQTSIEHSKGWEFILCYIT